MTGQIPGIECEHGRLVNTCEICELYRMGERLKDAKTAEAEVMAVVLGLEGTVERLTSELEAARAERAANLNTAIDEHARAEHAEAELKEARDEIARLCAAPCPHDAADAYLRGEKGGG